MFGLLDELKARIDGALKLAVAGSIALVAGLLAFVCFTVVLFLWTERSYCALEAWAVVGILFLVVALGGVTGLLVLRRRRPPESAARPAPAPSLLQNPAVIVAGIQLARSLGARGLLPLLVIGAIAGGLMMNRNGHGKAQQPGVERGHGTYATE